MSLDVSLSDSSRNGVPLIVHEGRKVRLCVANDVLSGEDDCDNESSLPQAICRHLGFDVLSKTDIRNSTK